MKRLRQRIEIAVGDHDGSVLVIVALMLSMLLLVIGVSIDAGLALNTRRLLQDTADSAARAAAEQIDLNTYRASAGATVVIDSARARAVAGSYLSNLPPDTTSAITVQPQRVTVQLKTQMPTTFMKVAHINSVPVTAFAPATVRSGIQQANA